MTNSLQALVPERMTEEAYERLYESINTGRLIGFVGSGLSLIYGNLTWDEFVKEIIARLEKEIKRARGEKIVEAREADRTLAQLFALKEDSQDSVIVLEFVRQAFRMIDEARRRPPDSAFPEALAQLFESDLVHVAKLAATRLELAGLPIPEDLDDPALLPDFLVAAVDLAKQRNPQEALDDVTTAKALYRFASDFYDTRAVKALGAISGTGRPGLVELAECIGKEDDRQRRSTRLPPDRRSILTVFLAAVVLDRGAVPGTSILPDEKDFDPDPAPPRPLLDPLNELHEDLAIRRFFTTNYDFEIENLFMFDDIREVERLPITQQDRDDLFARPDFSRTLNGAALVRHRPDGIRVRSDVNDGEHTAPLVEFAIGSSDGSIHIFHHHGRVDLPKTMIAADGEYNKMYRARGLNRESLDRAYDAMIEGNPILFVGSGMNEEELNRTLRMRVSNPRSPLDAPVFVLRSADKPAADLMREQLKLATKLGAHVIHYGHPRRGTGYDLRRHLLLIREIAVRFRPTGADSAKEWLKPYRVWAPTISAGKEEKEWLAAVLALPEEERRNQLRYFCELDFDCHLIPWLLGENGRKFAADVQAQATLDLEGLKKTPATGVRPPAGDHDRGLRAAALVTDYLRNLAPRIHSAALRHELRQINRESKLFYHRKARLLKPRLVDGFQPRKLNEESGWSRHLSVDGFGPAGDQAADGSGDRIWRPSHWQWVPLRESGGADGQPGQERYDALLGRISGGRSWRRGGTPVREIVIGERGTGKGGFLKHLEADLRKRDGAPRWLIVNCCYGQEADSVVSLIESFLNGPAPDEIPSLPRRQRIMRYRAKGVRPLIVLGAVDRLFGTENQPLGAEFDWLLRHLLRPETNVDLVVTASRRCEAYFTALRGELFPYRADDCAAWRVHSTLAHGTVRSAAVRALGQGFLRTLHDQGAQRELGWIREDLNDAVLRMSPAPRNTDLIVGREIEALRTETPQKAIEGESTDAREASRIGRLTQEILKALAFIGLPTEGEVLVSAPGVRRELARLITTRADRSLAPGSPTGLSAARLLGNHLARKYFLDALNHAMERNLIGVIEPHGEPARPDGEGSIPLAERAETAIKHRYRFVLHRIVSTVIRERFEVPINETVLSDSFNLSLYAAQPDNAPAFKPEITSDLEQLLDHLIHCWKDVSLAEPLEDALSNIRTEALKPEIYTANALAPDLLTRVARFERAVRMLDPVVTGGLRAAGGVIRGFFSSVTLLAFDLGDPRSRAGDRGVVSAHNGRIRMLLDYALEAQQVRDQLKEGREALLHGLDRIFAVDVWATCTEQDLETAESTGDETPGQDKRPPHRQWLRVRTVTPDDDDSWPGDSKAAIEAWRALRTIWRQLLDPGEPKAVLSRLDHRLAGLTTVWDPGEKHALQTRPFYAEEIVWLLNERAVLALAQGNLYTASTTFQLALEANSGIEGSNYYPIRCRLLLNRCLLWIERGKIMEARRCLVELQEGIGATEDALSAKSRDGRLILALATGYLGLCDQLNGLVRRAERLFRLALRQLGELREQRAIAIFEYHLGSLLQIDSDQRAAAAACFARAVAAAEGGRHTDILYRVRIAQAHNDRMRGAIQALDARAIFDRAIQYGEQLDMHRVTIDALSASIQLRLELGDVEAAALDCERALALASRYGMTLRRVWLRAMSGKVYRARNDFANAQFMFERAIEAAERIGYQRAIEVASTNLMSMPQPERDPAGS